MMPESTKRAALRARPLCLRRSPLWREVGGAEETAAYVLAYTVDLYVIDALLVEGPVDPGRNVPDVRREGCGGWILPELEAPLVHGRRGGGGDCFFFWVLVAFLDWTVVHPPDWERWPQRRMSSPGFFGGVQASGLALGSVGGGWGATGGFGDAAWLVLSSGIFGGPGGCWSFSTGGAGMAAAAGGWVGAVLWWAHPSS